VTLCSISPRAEGPNIVDFPTDFMLHVATGKGLTIWTNTSKCSRPCIQKVHISLDWSILDRYLSLSDSALIQPPTGAPSPSRSLASTAALRRARLRPKRRRVHHRHRLPLERLYILSIFADSLQTPPILPLEIDQVLRICTRESRHVMRPRAPPRPASHGEPQRAAVGQRSSAGAGRSISPHALGMTGSRRAVGEQRRRVCAHEAQQRSAARASLLTLLPPAAVLPRSSSSPPPRCFPQPAGGSAGCMSE
jgi:hypothetical protein